jgi:D-glycero-D-manno-heptose 1,7-bisphosphate phosphatase
VSRPTGTQADQPAKRRAVFLDRDGTIIEDPGYLKDAARIRLLPGSADAIARLNRRGLLAIVVTNQSGIARGLLSEADYQGTARRLDELLAASGAHVDAHYHCPHMPERTGPCECRKPGTLLYRQAADRFNIDLSRSWWVGDRARDVLPAASLNGRGILVLGQSDEVELPSTTEHRVTPVRDLAAAVELILKDS